jgi:hypothetical protein
VGWGREALTCRGLCLQTPTVSQGQALLLPSSPTADSWGHFREFVPPREPSLPRESLAVSAPATPAQAGLGDIGTLNRESSFLLSQN